MVQCPVCTKEIPMSSINTHLDSNCATGHHPTPIPTPTTPTTAKKPVALIFQRKPSFSLPRTAKRPSPPPLPLPHSPQPQPLKRVKHTHTHTHTHTPLAERMRPTSLDDIHGQPQLLGPAGALRAIIEVDGDGDGGGGVPSMLLWGGPGCGKTTVARVVAGRVGAARFVEMSAATAGVAEVKRVLVEARSELALTGRRTVLFCDEIHRFSKTQQDVFLPAVESGHIVLIGATTENPSFRIQSALLSRLRTFTFAPLTPSAITTILTRALTTLPTPAPPLITPTLLTHIAAVSSGDARAALNLLESAIALAARPDVATPATLKAALSHTTTHPYDRAGDAHYDAISAFHKSIRGSAADAALFWLARMLAAGEDPLYIARRMVVIASEDVGLADNSMLPLATATVAAVQAVGLPEARVNLAHCAVALAEAPKSVRVYRALGRAVEAVDGAARGEVVPPHLRNGVTALMRDAGCGVGYKYNPDYVDGRVKQEYMPEGLRGVRFLEDGHLGERVDPELELEDEEMEEEEEEGEEMKRGG